MKEGGRVQQLRSLFLDIVLPLADAYAATRSAFRWSLTDASLIAGTTRIPLDPLDRIYLVGAGKAGVPMARAVMDTLQEDDRVWSRFVGGTVNVFRDQAAASLPRVTFFPADHPNPNHASFEGARAALDLLKRTTASDLVIAIISGGGSSLLTLPHEGISLDDFRTANRALVTGGATIQEINTVRKRLSQVKGGRLRLAAPEARFLTLVLSDVVGDDLSSIASGPTVPDSTTCRDAIAVLERHGLWDHLPASCRATLQSGDPDEATRAALWRGSLAARTDSIVVASNAVILARLKERLSSPDYAYLASRVILEPSPATGPVSDTLERHFSRALESSSTQGTLLLFGGEPIVTVPPGTSGTGGRMLHYALLAARMIAGRDWAVLASGTDGIDGTSPAAGAVVTGATMHLAARHGLDVERYLEAFDSYGFFSELDTLSEEKALIATGPTGTNVNDIMLWSL
jgi:glycerate 2-kinase